MATRPTDPRPVSGRIDGRGRLIAADPELEALQREAGSSIGAPLAIPQLAAIARMARQLNIPIARRALAAGAAQDIDMWVRAVPSGDEVALTIERWDSRPPAGPRLVSVSSEAPGALSSAGRWSVDEQLRIVNISQSAAELLGVMPADAAGQPLTRLVKLEDDGEGAMPLLQALAARTGFSGQVALRRSDSVAVELSGQVVLGPSGDFAGFEGSAVPVDSGTGAPASDSTFSDLLHSPLRDIIASADRISDGAEGPIRDDYAGYAADISAAAHHLLSVVRSMSEESAAGLGSIDLVALVYEAVGLVETAASEREVEVAVEPLHSLDALGEARGVIQILVNLVTNAVRHSSEHATVTVSFERSGGHAIVHVADDGPGIDPTDQQRIFERFERGPGEGQGSGLGLAIARRLARSMNGDILLSSRLGMGSRFSLMLPAA